MRTLAPTLQTQVSATVTKPGYLVEIMFSTRCLFSSRGGLSWNGLYWSPRGLSVTGLANAGSGGASGELRLANADLVMSALVLGEGIAGRAIRIWQFYGDEPAAGDALLVFDGVGDEASVADDSVTIKLSPGTLRSLSAPRLRITAAAGFNHLTPPGTVILFGGGKITLKGRA
jgi:hypothetical protein